MRRVYLAVGLSLLAVVLFCAAPGHAQQSVTLATDTIVPPVINFSGELTDGSGKPLTETAGVTFSLYSESQGGAPLWTETQNLQPDATGHYSVVLGAATTSGLPGSLFASGAAHWLGVRVQGQEEAPRVMLVSAPYALKAGDAETLGGLPPAAFLQSPPSAKLGSASAAASAGAASPGSSGVSTAKPPKAPISGSGTAGFIPLWTSSSSLGNSEIFQSGTVVGIGTAAPAYTLDVKGIINTTSGSYGIRGCPVMAIASVNGGDPTSTAVGCRALAQDTSTVGLNTAIGSSALFSNTTGGNNTAIGYQALFNNTTGNDNTANGDEALFSNTTGSDNTATGAQALYSNSTASDNTASGYQALYSNTTGSANTASGYQTLYSNTTGNDNTASGSGALFGNITGNDNTAEGFQALTNNTTGSDNTAEGYQTLASNTTGSANTSGGYQALLSNTTGNDNTASGENALLGNTTGGNNTASGSGALTGNTTASDNTASGYEALFSNTTGSQNTASGYEALFGNTTGSDNTASGFQSLLHVSTGNNNIGIGPSAASSVSGANSNNIHIGSMGASGDSGTIRIGTSGTHTSFFVAGVRGVTTGNNDAIPVLIDSNGQLGTVSSSRRFKEDIQDMGSASEALMRLRPVMFRYTQPFFDGSQPRQYGLIAEDVAEVYPEMVARSADGQIATVKYQMLGPMLLNEVQRHDTEIREIQGQVSSNGAQSPRAEIQSLEERLDKLAAALADRTRPPQTP